jgi:hypothetical protein
MLKPHPSAIKTLELILSIYQTNVFLKLAKLPQIRTQGKEQKQDRLLSFSSSREKNLLQYPRPEGRKNVLPNSTKTCLPVSRLDTKLLACVTLHSETKCCTDCE